MESHHFLQLAVVFLLAAVIAVPLARRFKLGSVLGYLLAGAVIGPHVLGMGGDAGRVAQISQLGVVLMLFVIGLELSPSRLWVMRRDVFGLGVAQVLVTTTVVAGVAHLVFALSVSAAVVVGATLSLSSTAFGLQILTERKEQGSAHGRSAFAVLLFQDLAAIPLIAAVPLLGNGIGGAHLFNPISVLRVVGTILVVVLGGRYLLRPLFRIVARTRSMEVSTATALLVVIGTAWLMERVGVSAPLGAFLAGMLLADSEYRHELESHIEPFKGLLLGLFFISVGMSVDLSLLWAHPLLVLALVAALMLLKAVLLWPLARIFSGLDGAAAARVAVLLASGGEFAFVVLALASEKALLSAQQGHLLVLAISVSMAAMPLLVLAAAHILRTPERHDERAYDHIDGQSPRVIIAGFGRVGQIVARVLTAQNIAFVALESSVEQVEFTRRFGSTSIYYGDPARPDLLRAAGAEQAEVFVLATDDPLANVRTARIVRRHFPHLKIMARARNRQHVFRLMDLGIEAPVRETFHSSLKLTRQVMLALGMDAAVTEARVQQFRQHDERLLREQYLVYDDETELVRASQDSMDDLKQLFEADMRREQASPVVAAPVEDND